MQPTTHSTNDDDADSSPASIAIPQPPPGRRRSTLSLTRSNASIGATTTDTAASTPSTANDPSRPKRVTMGFQSSTVTSAPTTPSVVAHVGSASPFASTTKPTEFPVRSLPKIPTSARELSHEMQSYKSQIPGWSAEQQPLLNHTTTSTTSSTHLTIPGSSGAAPLGVPMSATSSSPQSPSKSFSAGLGNRLLSKSPRASTSITSILPESMTHTSTTSVSTPTTAQKQTFKANTPSTPVDPTEKPSKQSKADKKAQKQAQRAAKKAALGIAPGESGAASVPGQPLVNASHHQRQRSKSTDQPTMQPSSTQVTPSVRGEKRNANVNAGLPPGSSASQHATRRGTWTKNDKEVALFSHLATPGRTADTLKRDMRLKGQDLHPAIVRLGLAYQNYTILGSNQRCIALMQVFREVIQDYETPDNNTLCRHLDSYLKPQINFLVACRPLSVSMGNAIRFLKLEIANIPPETPEEDSKQYLDEKICTFVRDRITCAAEVIVDTAIQKIRDQDVILTFGSSSIIQKVLIAAYRDRGLSFRVIVVDSRPMCEGRAMVRELAAHGLPCTYVHISALSYVMKEATKVFLGAHAMLSNGTLMSRTGTAMVALCANNQGIPVIVCCETYKFSDRVQLDSFVNNELGDPDALVDVDAQVSIQKSVLQFGAVEAPHQPAPIPVLEKKLASMNSFATQGQVFVGTGCASSVLAGWREQANLKLLNLMYDVTPSQFITVVITEIGMIPCSSVPVVVRTYQANERGQALN